MAKSVSDATWFDLKTMLAYKAVRLGVVYKEVNESFSTVTCSECGSRCGPRGVKSLGVREWTCIDCGVLHSRDVNAAINILLSGQGIDRQLRERALVA
jgi:putative transposase